MGTRFIIETECTIGGGSTNPALTTFHVDMVSNGLTFDMVAAQLVCAMQYMSQADGVSCSRIFSGGDTGPTLPRAWPTTDYNALQALDGNLVPLTGFGDIWGSGGDLAPLGSGAVFTKRTALAGRHGLGRLTTPWLPAVSVDGGGQLDPVYGAVFQKGVDTYILGNNAAIPTQTLAANLDTYIYPANAPVLAMTLSRSLGRLRSRKA